MDKEKRKWAWSGRWNPCKGCEDRKLGCHGKCDKYQKFVEESKKIYDKRLENRKLGEYKRDAVYRGREERWKPYAVLRSHKK